MQKNLSTAKSKIPQTAIFLGIVSLLNDTASEAIYPILPIFLTQVIGVSATFLGIYEGLAESIASLTKYFSGALSDRIRGREKLVFIGYLMTNLARPITGIITTPAQALLIRLSDRVGKGIRSAPRDAWLADACDATNRGRVFGFHRAMDHLGATIGPLFATAFLYFLPGEYRLLFLLTAIPGFTSLYFIARAKKPEHHVASTEKKSIRDLLSFREFDSVLKKYFLILLLFTIANSSDAFLILKLKHDGFTDFSIPLLWAGLHIIKVLSSLYGGDLSDRIDRKAVIIAGWIIFAITYSTFGTAQSKTLIMAVFFLYGIFSGLTEGTEKALVADFCQPHFRGKAFGVYNLVMGIAALPASAIAGLLWDKVSPQAPFLFSSGLAIVCAVALLALKNTQKQ